MAAASLTASLSSLASPRSVAGLLEPEFHYVQCPVLRRDGHTPVVLQDRVLDAADKEREHFAGPVRVFNPGADAQDRMVR